jgi:hypothetical protein
MPIWYVQEQAYPTPGPPSFVTLPATWCLDCAYTCTIKITPHFGLLYVPLIVIFTPGAHEPAHSNGHGPCAEESSEAPVLQDVGEFGVVCGEFRSGVPANEPAGLQEHDALLRNF